MKKILFALLMIFTMCKGPESSFKVKYPDLQKDVIIDNYFGTEIQDPYRRLENLEDSLVRKWFRDQTEFYTQVSKQIPGREMILSEMTLANCRAEVYTEIPRAAGEKIFYRQVSKREDNQKIIFRKSLAETEIELFKTGDYEIKNLNIDYYEPSYSGKYLVLGLSSGETEATTMHIFDVEKKEMLPDTIPRVLYGNPQWLADETGFFYTQMKKIENESDRKTMYEDSEIKLHMLQSNSLEDKTVFSIGSTSNNEENIGFPFVYTFPNSDLTLLAIYYGSQNYASLFHAPTKELLSKKADQIKWRDIVKAEDKVEGYAISKSDIFLLDYSSNTNGNISKMSLTDPQKKQIIIEGKEVIQGMIQTKNSIYIKTLEKGINKLKRLNIEDLVQEEVILPFEGAIDLRSHWLAYLHSDDMFFGIESWNKVFGVYNYDIDSKKMIKAELAPVGELEKIIELEVKELEVKSHDGELVPLSIIHQKGLSLNGSNPTILYGYGSYGTSIMPTFSISRLSWLKRGGIYAVAHVRGGGEKGDGWYKGGFKKNKPNSWKDFIACAEYLIDKNYTSKEKLAAQGESAGGITVGRAITERPGLFKAGIISVGVLNALRFEKTINTLNIAEFGTAKDSLEFSYLKEMDVYLSIKDNVNYPSLLFSTAMNDQLVEPWQPAKVVAKMQQISKGDNLILFYVGDNGHFGGNSTDSYLSEIADQYAFLFWRLGHAVSE